MKFLLKHNPGAHTQPPPISPSQAARVLPHPSCGWRAGARASEGSWTSNFGAKARGVAGAGGDTAASKGHRPGWEPGAKNSGLCSHHVCRGPSWIQNFDVYEISSQEDARNKLSSDNSYQVVRDEKSRHAQNVLTSNSCGLSERECILCPFFIPASPSSFSPLHGFLNFCLFVFCFLPVEGKLHGTAAEGKRQRPEQIPTLQRARGGQGGVTHHILFSSLIK